MNELIVSCNGFQATIDELSLLSHKLPMQMSPFVKGQFSCVRIYAPIPNGIVFKKKFQKKTHFQQDSSVLIDDCSVAVWALVVSSSEFYFDWNSRDVADGSSEHQWQCLAHMGAGLGVSPRIFHIQALHDRAAHFIQLSGVCFAIGGRGLNMHPPARDP